MYVVNFLLETIYLNEILFVSSLVAVHGGSIREHVVYRQQHFQWHLLD